MKLASEKKESIIDETFMQGNQLPLLVGTLIAKVDNLDRKIDDRFFQLDKKMDEQKEKAHKLSNEINGLQAKFMIDEERAKDEDKRAVRFRFYFSIIITLLGVFGIVDLFKHFLG